MFRPRRFGHTGKVARSIAQGLAVLVLVAGCGGPPIPEPTPVAALPTSTAAITPAATTAAPTAPLSSATATEAEPTATTAPTAPPAITPIAAWAPTIRWRGGDRFLLGVNFPYHRYGNDFGGNAWGNYGAHDPATYAAVDADFARMSSLGVRTARWFVFADGRAGLTFDAAGLPTGLDPFVFPDLDAALEIAGRHNIGLNLVLLDFRFLWDARVENGVQLGGHASVLATPKGQEALVNNVFEPVFRRYAAHPVIVSWEVMNEPEWALQDAGDVDRTKISQPLSLATFRTFAQLTVDAIHSAARAYATIGSADAKWAHNWVGLGLDYYQIHYYDWMKPYSTDNLFAMRAESLGLDRPVVVGEFPADHSTVSSLVGYLDAWYVNGFAGAWAWSFRADTAWGAPDPEIFRAWATAHRAAADIPPAP